MKKLEHPITDENFSEIWTYANKKLLEIQKKKVVRNVLSVFVNIAFLLCMSFITFVTLLLFANEPILESLNIPYINDTWNKIKILLPYQNLPIAQRTVIYIILAYAICILLAIILTLVVWFIYHPNTIKNETGNKKADSKELYEIMRTLDYRVYNTKGITSTSYSVAYILEILAIVFVVAIPLFKPLIDSGMFANSEATAFTLSIFLPFLPYIIMIFLFICGTYALFNAMLSFFLRPLYKTKFELSYVQESKDYYFSYNPEIESEILEDTRILKEASKITLKRNQNKIKGPYTPEEQIIMDKVPEIRAKRKREEEEFLQKNKP